jgi:glycosyltransferase involved in cell wall biosynthesis
VTEPTRISEPPRISILVPTWNAAATVERALESVLAERDVPLEVVVVDDASTDGTADVVAEIATRDPRIVLLTLETNEGVSNARNRGLAAVRGEWLAFLDADDRFLPGAITALIRPTVDPDVRAVVGQRVHDDGERQWVARGYDNPDIREPGRKSIAANPGLMYYAAIHGKLFHRSLIDGLRFEGRVLGDQPWTISALLRAGQAIEVVGETVYEWSRPHPDRYVEGITSATRSSSARAADMATRATDVFGAVSAEVDERIGDATTRATVKGAYFDRLIRMDIGPAIGDSLRRRDPATSRLLDAVASFLASVPAPILAASDPLVHHVVVPPARRWHDLVPSARTSYWDVVRVIYRPGVPLRRHGRWQRIMWPALLILARSRSPLATAAVSVVIGVLSSVARSVRRLRRR